MPNAAEDATVAFEEALAMSPGAQRMETLLIGMMSAQLALREGLVEIENLLRERDA